MADTENTDSFGMTYDRITGILECLQSKGGYNGKKLKRVKGGGGGGGGGGEKRIV